MSLSSRLNKKQDQASSEENTVKQLKLLSKAQTALLKAYLQEKLNSASQLVSKASEYIGMANDSEGKELKAALANLKLEELEVDVTSIKLDLQDELRKLREAIENGGSLPITTSAPVASSSNSSTSTAANSEALKASESECNRLRTALADSQKQLAEVQKQLTASQKQIADNKKLSDVASKQSSQSGEEIARLNSEIAGLNDQIVKLKGENASLNDQLKRLTSQGSDKDGNITKLNQENVALNNQVNDLKKEVADLKKSLNTAQVSRSEIETLKRQKEDLEAQKIQVQKDAEKKMNDRVRDAKEAAKKEMQEKEKAWNAEKEELETAMAQEIEDVEKKAESDKKQLNTEIANLKKKLSDAQNFNSSLSVSIQKLAAKAKALQREKNELTASTKRDLNDYGTTIQSYMSRGLMNRIKKVEDDIKVAYDKYHKEMAERKRLHNLVQELKGNIRVFMRCRPPTNKEIEQFGNDACCVSFPGPQEVKVYNDKNKEKVWEFDEVFGTDTTQEQVFKEVSGLVTSVLDGYNVCIFAYGQTGSGKTWTMSGPADNRGVNTRALDELFRRSRDRSGDFNDTISVSLLEVYNEQIRDLLSADGKSDEKLEVKMGEHGNYVPGLTQVPVDSLEAVIRLIAFADRNRSQAVTNMNEHSSRSHMMLTVTIISEYKPTGVVTRGRLNLVDLAGSERIDKSGAQGVALKEAQNINKSLSALGDVIAARAQKAGHVPFRNSTLTYLLQDSLSQDSKTLMIVCVSPVLYNADETFCSLNFAARVRTVELGKVTRNTVTPGVTQSAKVSSTASSTLRKK